MPIKKNAKKYMRVTDHKTAQNKVVKGVFKSAIKATREAVATEKLDAAKEAFKKAQKAIDKAVAKGVLKKNTAARKKSRLNAAIKKTATK
jgi:small subunit ribosomal protein S20